jgi:hypothetical protein
VLRVVLDAPALSESATFHPLLNFMLAAATDTEGLKIFLRDGVLKINSTL